MPRSLSVYVAVAGLTWVTGCLPAREYRYARKTTKEELRIHPRDSSGLLMKKFDELSNQDIPTLEDRLERTRPSRGLITPMATSLIGYAVSGAKTIISNEKGKYTSVTKFTKTELYFYDQPSVDGPFDPAGMQFTGFDLVRTIKNDAGETDTAFLATFEVDTTKADEILNNHVFRLRLTAFREKYIKPKVAVLGRRKMSVEFDISFLTSYISDKGIVHDSVVLGKFHAMLKDIDIEQGSPEFGRCTKGEKEMEVSGKSYIVPRSMGYFKTNNRIIPGYNQGSFSIVASVKECTKPAFAESIIIENGNTLLEEASGAASSKTSAAPAKKAAPAKTTN